MMVFLRLILILVVLVLLVSGALYLFSRDPRYLRFAVQFVRWTVFVSLALVLLWVLERFVLSGWRFLA